MKKKRNTKLKEIIKNNYSQSWNYIKESKKYIWFILIIFLMSSILVFLGLQNPLLNEKITEYLKQIIEEFQGLSIPQTILKIFLNNLKSSFFSMILGILLGIFPALAVLVNAYVLGFVADKTVQTEGYSILLKLLPHGIFEIPAIILALALGIKLGFFIFTKNKKQELVKRLNKSMRVFLFIILPLLILAAIIEGILIFVW